MRTQQFWLTALLFCFGFLATVPVFAQDSADCPLEEGVNIETATIKDCTKIIYKVNGDKDNCPCTKKFQKITIGQIDVCYQKKPAKTPDLILVTDDGLYVKATARANGGTSLTLNRNTRCNNKRFRVKVKTIKDPKTSRALNAIFKQLKTKTFDNNSPALRQLKNKAGNLVIPVG